MRCLPYSVLLVFGFSLATPAQSGGVETCHCAEFAYQHSPLRFDDGSSVSRLVVWSLRVTAAAQYDGVIRIATFGEDGLRGHSNFACSLIGEWHEGRPADGLRCSQNSLDDAWGCGFDDSVEAQYKSAEPDLLLSLNIFALSLTGDQSCDAHGVVRPALGSDGVFKLEACPVETCEEWVEY